MAEGTSFEVESVLKVRDEASSAVEQLGRVADKTGTKLKALEGIAAPSFTNLGGAFGGVTEQVQSLKSVIFELAAGVGIATSLKGAFDKFIDTNAESETATRSFGVAIASLYDHVSDGKKLDPIANLHHSLKKSDELMTQLNKTAFDTGIPMSKLAASVKTLAPGIAAAGGSTDQLIKLTTDAAKLSRGMGLGYEESASQLQMAVKYGRMGRGGTGILSNIGVDKKKLASMTTEAARLKYITERITLAKPDEIAKLTTYTDLIGVVRERMDQIAEAAGKPLFEKAKATVKQVGDWIEKNRDKIQKTAELVATKFVEALEASIAVVKYLYEHWEKVQVVVMLIAGVLVAKKAASWAREFGQSIADVTKRIAEMHAVKLGQQFGDAAAPGLDKVGGGIGKAAAAGMILEAAMIGYAIGTAINGWLEKQPFWIELMTPGKSDKETVSDAQASKADAYDTSQQQRLNDLLFKAQLGNKEEERALLNTMLETAIKAKDGSNGAFDAVRNLRDVLDGLGEGLANESDKLRIGDIRRYMADHNMATSEVFKPPPPAAVAPTTPTELNKRNYDFRNSHFDITQNFAEGFDPDRIAVAFTNDLSSLGEMRSSSTYAPIAGVR